MLSDEERERLRKGCSVTFYGNDSPRRMVMIHWPSGMSVERDLSGNWWDEQPAIITGLEELHQRLQALEPMSDQPKG